MGIHTYEIIDSSGDNRGAILMQSTANMPLPLTPFESAEDADAFAEWCYEHDLVMAICTEGEAEKVRDRWEAERR